VGLSARLTISCQTGLFSSIVASFLIETYKTLLPDTGSQTVSLLTQLVAPSDSTARAPSPSIALQGVTPLAIRINVIMFLSLFFSVSSALVSTLIQQWAREYLQYSQASAAPRKRGRVRTYLLDGLCRFQMIRLTYGIPVLLPLAVSLFFLALSDWLYSINVSIGATAYYCLVASLITYMSLSILPFIVRNAPYQTALTTPLQACIYLIQASYLFLIRLLQRTSRVYETQKGSKLINRIHVDRARTLMKEMDTFLNGLPRYIHSPLTDTRLLIEGLKEDGAPWRIREHFMTCVTSVELSE
jgi:hypothetical protein